MNLPLVSIVLPTFNGERYLRQALDSCLQQSYSNWELIVVDDASSDTTPKILEQYCCADGRIRVVRHQVNRRLPAALNTGFSHASGEFLTWTSDDNLFRPEALAVMTEALGSQPEIGVVYANFTLIDEVEGLTRQITVGKPEQVAVSNCIGPCFLYRRSVHEALGGYDERMFLAEDYDFWLRAWRQFSFRQLNRDLYLYRNHELSLTNMKRTRILQATAQVRARFHASAKSLSSEVKARGWVHQVDSATLCRQPWLAAVYLCRAMLANLGYVLRSERRLFRQIVSMGRK